MPSRPDLAAWQLRPVTEALVDLTYEISGAGSARLLDRLALLEHPAVAFRIQTGHTPALAIQEAYLAGRDDALRGEFLTHEEYEAVGILLGFRRSAVVHGVNATPITPQERATVADQLVTGTGWGDAVGFRRGLRSGSGKHSALSDLMDKFALALDAAPTSRSASSGVRRSPRSGDPTTDGTRPPWPDLVGTWRGTTTGARLFKGRPGDPRPHAPLQTALTYLVVSIVRGELQLRWLYSAGISHAIAVRPVEVDNGVRRLVCVFDADRDGSEELGAPSHHGACLLDILGQPAATLSGPYWNDRHATGFLTFDHRVAQPVGSFESAERLRWPSPEPPASRTSVR